MGTESRTSTVVHLLESMGWNSGVACPDSRGPKRSPEKISSQSSGTARVAVVSWI